MIASKVTIDDKYALTEGRAYMSGLQALVRLPLIQHARDKAAGLNTGCFISGYRGSPLAAYDSALVSARKYLEPANIVFEPGVNEDLAVTSIWGSQQVGLYPGAKVDGVFGIWYGKAPGVDRSMDAFRFANHGGSSRYGGVLALAGDDHDCSSSSLPSQSEQMFEAVMMPIINPATLQDYLDFGVYGFALSRFSGCWIGFKTTAETVETSTIVDVSADRVNLTAPEFDMPHGGLNIRWPDPPLAQEARLHGPRMAAVAAFLKANSLDRTIIDSKQARLGIVTTGKAYLDVREALQMLGISDADAAALGIRLYKLGVAWPLEREGALRFANGLEEIFVVEEKRAFIETQFVSLLYNMPADQRPRIIGKNDEFGAPLMHSEGAFKASEVAHAIAARLERFGALRPEMRERLERLALLDKLDASKLPSVSRTPYFCSGCPHNSSTKVPEGSRALGGVGCHTIATWMPTRNTVSLTHMGGEGALWIGQAPFTEENHVFQNLGDGTYYHSGLMALRAAAASGVNITYKILFNDAVAMTGGQPIEGELNVPQITRQVAAEGAKQVVVVADDVNKYGARPNFAAGVTIRPREELEQVQNELREVPGLTVLVYDQTCAAEKRRRRKRGKMVDPDRRIFINSAVCEGCGDCSVKSNCISVKPLETELGRKREIDQSSCNKDYSCVEGFCPSFVSLYGANIRKPEQKLVEVEAERLARLPHPKIPVLNADQPISILVAGVGGTGVLTISALLGMAAHVDGITATVLDNTGAAQKNGAVTSHIRLSPRDSQLVANRIPTAGTNVLLACDMMVATARENVVTYDKGKTFGVVNSSVQPMGAYVLNPDIDFQLPLMESTLKRALGQEHLAFIDGSGIATALLGDSIGSNVFMMGYAWQKGLIPISGEAIERAIEMNGVAVAANKRAFGLGRLAAADPEAVLAEASPAMRKEAEGPLDFEGMRTRRAAMLAEYQNQAYADRYLAFVDKIATADRAFRGSTGALSLAVAHNLYRLMAYKDEYEVARLYSNPKFRQDLERQFTGKYKLRFHLAPPVFTRRDKVTGELKKRSFGAWMLPLFGLLARLKPLRGTAFDIFGYTHERQTERALIERYMADLDDAVARLDAGNYDLVVELARLSETIRGFGHIKERNLVAADRRRLELLADIRDQQDPKKAAQKPRTVAPVT